MVISLGLRLSDGLRDMVAVAVTLLTGVSERVTEEVTPSVGVTDAVTASVSDVDPEAEASAVGVGVGGGVMVTESLTLADRVHEADRAVLAETLRLDVTASLVDAEDDGERVAVPEAVGSRVVDSDGENELEELSLGDIVGESVTETVHDCERLFVTEGNEESEGDFVALDDETVASPDTLVEPLFVDVGFEGETFRETLLESTCAEGECVLV